jgi:hypothetical protein
VFCCEASTLFFGFFIKSGKVFIYAVLYETPVVSVVTGSVTRMRYDGLTNNEKGGHHDRFYY